MITNGYADLTQFKLRVGSPAGSAHDDEGERAVEAASRAVDLYCGRRFYPDTVASARYYTATYPDLLPVDDLYTTVGLVVATDDNWDGTFENTWTLNSRTGPYGFMVQPANAVADGRPVTRLRAVAGSWTMVEQGISVTAKWGWVSVPAPVVEATLILASRWYKRKDVPFGVMGTQEVGYVTLPKTDPDVAALLQPYRRMDDG